MLLYAGLCMLFKQGNHLTDLTVHATHTQYVPKRQNWLAPLPPAEVKEAEVEGEPEGWRA